jgi:hypothetical protein
MSTAEKISIQLDGVRGQRYGEMLMASIDGTEIVGEVWSTFTLNDCSDDAWNAIVAEEEAQAHGCHVAIKNGPRVWLMDSITKLREGEHVEKSFGELPMRRIAQLRLDASTVGSPTYTERFVDRKTVFAWEAGRTIYQLVDPSGLRYTLQAYCLSVDPTLDESALEHLGERLELPEGWTYEVSTLDRPFEIDTLTAEAAVIQDEFENTYSRAQ